MAESNPAGQLHVILAELRDTDKAKRRTAVMKLGMLGGEEAVTHLIRLVDNQHEDTIVRGKAAQLLGMLGDTRAVLPLIRALEAPGYQTPLHAVESLGKLGDPRAVAPLRLIVETKKDRLREAALEALKRLGDTTQEVQPDEPLPMPQP
ncbi:MAG: HEAT repeat domain-containing protein [Anaerolineae bacterium]